MSGSLIDTNVWIAAIFSSHPCHTTARQLLQKMTAESTAVFCRATEQSFLRLASNPLLLKTYGAEGMHNRDALATFASLVALPQIVQREEPPGTASLWHHLASCDTATPKVWMDAYLAAFAIRGGLRLVTLDRDFIAYRANGLNLVLLGAVP